MVALIKKQTLIYLKWRQKKIINRIRQNVLNALCESPMW